MMPLLAVILLASLVLRLHGDDQAVVIDIADFGAVPDSGRDAALAFQQAIAAAKAVNAPAPVATAAPPTVAAAPVARPVVIRLHPGRYDIFPEHAAIGDYHITNTGSEEEVPSTRKPVGLHLVDCIALTIDGGGALLMLHGKMLPIALERCRDVLIRDLHVDFARPTMSELTVVAVAERSLDAQIHGDSPYEIAAGRLTWVGEGWRDAGAAAQGYDPVRDTTWRGWNPVTSAASASELKPGLVRFTYAKKPDARPGLVFQLDDAVRDMVGVLMVRCRGISWQDVGMHYMHGLGFVGQFSEDLTFRRVTCEPRPESGRSCAGSADFMQFSGCRGTVRVLDSRFAGSKDDPINVHGTHLRIVARPDPLHLVVRFMHAQTYGFAAFAAGDEIEFVHTRTLLSYGAGTVRTVEMLSPREQLLTLAAPAPAGAQEDDCVENISATPAVEIRGCRFRRDPTRGILVTTRRTVVIADNRFERTTMSAILISDDAKYWFESGPVRDVTISGNLFQECAEPVIHILPENTEAVAGACVHRNIRILGNRFELTGTRAISAKSTDGLAVRGNTFVCAAPTTAEALIQLTACEHVDIGDNRCETR